MKNFFQVKTVEEVLLLLEQFEALPAEEVDLPGAAFRVLAEDIGSDEDIPDFDRSTMDGFAVRARDTFGATEGLPGLFDLVGEVRMGSAPGCAVDPGQAVRVWTGGMMPPGSDAVVMIEYSRLVDETQVELARPAAPGDNVIRRGEDIRRGQVLIPRGRRLRPQDVGLLAAMGRTRVPVRLKPRAAVLSTGDEIVPIEQRPREGQVRDVNSYSLAAMIEQAGAGAERRGLVKDDPRALGEAVASSLERADVVILSGGSSVGVRDFTIEALESIPGASILVHGVAVSPGKPTIMAKVGNKSVWGLPGHTVSAMITCDLFVRPLLSRLEGELGPDDSRGKVVTARLARNAPSVHGRTDFIRVRLEKDGPGYTAHPIFGKSGLISTMVKADGLIKIDLHQEGLPKGVLVEVKLFD
ncbi:MAG: gephyrin-like molybdotransferase Glp [Pseudomonadota bacterium]